MAIFARDCIIKAVWLKVTPFGLPVVPVDDRTTKSLNLIFLFKFKIQYNVYFFITSLSFIVEVILG
jgi:hypothetical protein